ncbi:hypothetical protein AVEN_19995-1 [Araneus ventricosus]|uniref:Uncharacterized protein n=1 Tax=Araneus ventricosus TaxID=182803 RepID=A0A4Y2PUZ4_ARAVE|nr:hypothetical protein AVEN_19995-1 [Araneus ventricosus]
MNGLLQRIVRMAVLTGIFFADPLRMMRLVSGYPPFSPLSADTDLKHSCPRREDIHPCECQELLKTESTLGEFGKETFVSCRSIQNSEVMEEAINYMKGHMIDFMIVDNCKLPLFHNGLFFKVGVKRIEILNSTVELRNNLFECASKC